MVTFFTCICRRLPWRLILILAVSALACGQSEVYLRSSWIAWVPAHVVTVVFCGKVTLDPGV